MRQYYKRELEQIYLEGQHALLDRVHTLCAPYFINMAAAFYKSLQDDPDTAGHLNDKLVAARLHSSMVNWLKTLFQPKQSSDIDDFIRIQLQIGHAHARIQIPMHSVGKGMRIIKEEFSKILHHKNVELDEDERTQIILFLNCLLDLCLELINYGYLNNIVSNERNWRSMNMSVLSPAMAVECEKVRARLYEWHIDYLGSITKVTADQSLPKPDIRHSEFSLWLRHKGELLFPGHESIVELKQSENDIHQLVDDIAKNTSDHADFQRNLSELSAVITHAGWLLSSLAEYILSQDNNRDPLTRLYNRRYLPVILQRETQLSINHDMSYAILFADLDLFKQMNDEFGHEAGDIILKEVAEQINAVIRTGDFAFRYGGEEFLIIITDTDINEAQQIAERMRRQIEANKITLPNNQTIQQTISIGIAMHDGNPDYSQCIARADNALYEAKSKGRNRYEIAT